MAIVTLAMARLEHIAVLRDATIVRMYDIPQAADGVGRGRLWGISRVVFHTLEKEDRKQASKPKQASRNITASNDSRAVISRAMVSGSNRYRARSNNE